MKCLLLFIVLSIAINPWWVGIKDMPRSLYMCRVHWIYGITHGAFDGKHLEVHFDMFYNQTELQETVDKLREQFQIVSKLTTCYVCYEDCWVPNEPCVNKILMLIDSEQIDDGKKE